MPPLSQRFLLYVLVFASMLGTVQARRYTDEEIKAMFLDRPLPKYPYEMRRLRITGSGLFRLYVDNKGKVTSVKILETTGRRELDEESRKAFQRWRAMPGKAREVDVPATFTMKYPRKGEI